MSKTEEKNVKIRILGPEQRFTDIKSGIVVRGEFVMPGGVCEVTESDAADLILRGRAELA